MKLTEAQREAVYARNHSILVSAAAGSGKTAVLVERIVTLIREGASLSEMMICTFTRAAAGEMRQRLAKRLKEEAEQDPVMMGQALDELESAEVSTIHAFCQKLLRDEFQTAGIDPMSALLSEQRIKLMFDEAQRLAINDLLDKDHEDFAYLCEAAGQKDVSDWNGTLYNFLMSIPHPFEWLEDQIIRFGEKPFRESPLYPLLVNRCRLQLESIPNIIHDMEEMLKDPNALEIRAKTVESDRLSWEKCLERLNQGEDIADVVAGYSLAAKARRSKGATEEEKIWDDAFGEIRKKQKTLLDKIRETLAIDEDELHRKTAVIRRLLNGLSALTHRTWEIYSANKRHETVIDFSDLEQLALSVLDHEDIREKVQGTLKHIFVDECQDVSAIQDAIIQRLHGPDCCLFMVGDVKQSIYRFRLADPTLFLERMRTWSDDPAAEERRIFLSTNFRSRPAILAASNQVFRNILRPRVTELRYEPQDELIPGRSSEGEHDPV